MRVTNVIPLGCSPLLPVDTVYSVQPLKVFDAIEERVERFAVQYVALVSRHELYHYIDDVTQH